MSDESNPHIPDLPDPGEYPHLPTDPSPPDLGFGGGEAPDLAVNDSSVETPTQLLPELDPSPRGRGRPKGSKDSYKRINPPRPPRPPKKERKARPRPAPKDPWAPDTGYPDTYGMTKREAEKSKRLRVERPEVALHAARMIISNNMDFEAAAAKMMPDENEGEIMRMAAYLRRSNHVQRALNEMFSKLGFDDAALKRFTALLWAGAHSNNEKKFAVCMRILGEFMGIQRKLQEGKAPVTLPIQDYEKGVLQMFGGKIPDASAYPTEDDATMETEASFFEDDDNGRGNSRNVPEAEEAGTSLHDDDSDGE